MDDPMALLPSAAIGVLWMTRPDGTVAIGLRPRATVPSGHPQHLGVIVLTVALKGMKKLYTVAQSRDALNTYYLAAPHCRKVLFDLILYAPVNTL